LYLILEQLLLPKSLSETSKLVGHIGSLADLTRKSTHIVKDSSQVVDIT